MRREVEGEEGRRGRVVCRLETAHKDQTVL